ncbi:hypothetical protein BH20CHL6_BH20CHL6_06830 [soil metagenome]
MPDMLTSLVESELMTLLGIAVAATVIVLLAAREVLGAARPDGLPGRHPRIDRVAVPLLLVLAVVLGGRYIELLRNPATVPGASPIVDGSTSPVPGSPVVSGAASTPAGTGSPATGPTGSPGPSRSDPSPSSPLTPTPSELVPDRPGVGTLHGTVLPIAFPLPDDADYEYVTDFLSRRRGEVLPYNHSRARGDARSRRRAQDGVDIAVPRGTRVLAPFAGTVVDPSERWVPWLPRRYGGTVVIVSSEPESAGYTMILGYLDRSPLSPGDRVQRGDTVGISGATGTDAAGKAALHVELRAPFTVLVFDGGDVRALDAIDPYPSLASADPGRP